MKLAAWLLGILFVSTYAGAYHPAIDSIGIARMPLALALIALLIFRQLRRTYWFRAFALAAVGVMAHEAVLWSVLRDDRATFTLYQRNLWFGNSDIDALLADIARHDPDVITLQEISPTNEPLLAALRPNYPHQHRCHYGTSYSLAVLSRLPPTSSSPMCSDVRGLAAIEITAPDGPGWVASVHLFWPWPYAQRPQVNEIAERLKALPGRKVVAGDFNQVPWSHAVKTLRRASAANYLGPRRATYSLHGIPLPIDHVLAPTGSVTRIPKHGSKHRGLLARIAFWPF